MLGPASTPNLPTIRSADLPKPPSDRSSFSGAGRSCCSPQRSSPTPAGRRDKSPSAALSHPEALRRAGIGYEEIVGGHHTPAELRRVVERVVMRAAI